MTKKLKRKITIYASVGVGAAVLWAVLHFVGWRRVLHEFIALGPVGGAVFLLNAGAMFFLWALTWNILLHS